MRWFTLGLTAAVVSSCSIAAPRDDAGTATDGGTGAQPSYFSSAPNRQWGNVPNSTLSESGVMLPEASGIIGAYSGGIMVTAGLYVGPTFIPGHFLVPYGGGHTIATDEIYAFGPFESSSPSWHLVRGRTNPPVVNVNADSNGNPVSVHTYSSIVYTGPTRNELLRMGGLFRYSDISSPPETYRFNFNQPNPANTQPWSKGADLLGGSLDIAAYESTTGRVWGRAALQFDRVNVYDLATDTHQHSDQSKTSHAPYYRSATAIDTNRGLWFSIGGGQYDFYRTNNGVDNDWYVPTTTDTAPTADNGACVWDSVGDAFIVWNDRGKTLFKLSPPASAPYAGGDPWTWSSFTPTGGVTPSDGHANGTFGRFNIAYLGGTARIYVLMNSVDEPIFFFKEE